MKKTQNDFLRYSLFIAFVTLVIAFIINILATATLASTGWAIGMLVVLVIILIGVFFDILGIAATAAREEPFLAMCADKRPGAMEALRVVRNADKFSNFCNDVIGDIAGIISGVSSAAVVIGLIRDMGVSEGSAAYIIISVLFSSLVAALTVGGKAFGKSYAIKYSTQITFTVGRFLAFLEKYFKISFFKSYKGKGR
jgi:CBS domain containing-hemolysin-like protein